MYNYCNVYNESLNDYLFKGLKIILVCSKKHIQQIYENPGIHINIDIH